MEFDLISFEMMFRVSLLFLALGLARARDGPAQKGRTPVMGWNTWCTQNQCGHDWCSSAEVLDVAKTIKANGMLALGYDHINLDDCWGVRDNQTKEIMGDPTRFPEGMPAFIDSLHRLGFKFGLYTDIGKDGCHHPFVGSWPDYQRDANTFAKWKVDFVKFDGCDLPEGHDAKTLTCNMSQALNHTGRDMWLNFHCWHDEACATCGNSFRITHDHHDDWDNTASVIKFLATHRQTFWGANPMKGWPDPDFVFTGGEGCGEHSAAGVRCPGQTDAEYTSEFSIWAIAGGSLILASDPRNMSTLQSKLLLNEEVIAVFKDVSGFEDVAVKEAVRPPPPPPYPGPPRQCHVTLEKQTSHADCTLGASFDCIPNYDWVGRMWTDHGCRGTFQCNSYHDVSCDVMGEGRHECGCLPPAGQLWFRPLSDGTSVAVVLHNPAGVSQPLHVDFGQVPGRSWGETTRVSVRDLWERSTEDPVTGQTRDYLVEAHGAVFLKLSPM
jgi:alpha-galactosidase